MKNPCLIVGNNEKQYYTVNYCCNAKGDFLPPYIIYKAKHLYNTWCLGGPPDTAYNTSPSGWMEADQFYQWFESLFLKHTTTMSKLIFKSIN